MKTLTQLLVLFFFVASCHKEESTSRTDGDGVIITLDYQWKKSLHNGLGFHSNGYFKNPIYYNGNIAIPTTNGENNRFLTMINPDNGATIWQWNDSYWPYSNQITAYYHYQYNNLLTYQTGDKSYCINLDNGTTQWKYQRSEPYDVRVSGLDDSYFTLGQSTSQYAQYLESVVLKGNMTTGTLEEFIVPHFTLNNIAPGNRIGDVTGVMPYMHNDVQYLAILWQEPQNVNSINDWQTYLGLYNYDTNQWVYEKKIINQPNINGVLLAPPKIYNDKIYVDVGKELFCHDLMTGNQIWSKQFTQDFMFSGFIIADDKIIANNEDTYTYGLNPEDGSILWRTETAGTSGRMSYLNGIVYFVGGSTGKLHALDVNTGKHVWKIDAENLGEPYGSSFKTNAVYVFPAANGSPAKVIALTHLNAYSFKAYQ